MPALVPWTQRSAGAVCGRRAGSDQSKSKAMSAWRSSSRQRRAPRLVQLPLHPVVIRDVARHGQQFRFEQDVDAPRREGPDAFHLLGFERARDQNPDGAIFCGAVHIYLLSLISGRRSGDRGPHQIAE